MRDDWIFKLAIIAGLLAFTWRLLSFPPPDNQQQLALQPQNRVEREATRAERNGHHIDAAVLLTALQPDQYNNHNGWHRISNALVATDAPDTVMERWKSLALEDPQSITDNDGNPVLDDEHIDLLRTFFEDTGGEAFVAYYLGVKLINQDEPTLAQEAFQKAYDGFSALVASRSKNATLWDRLYVARSAMRLELTQKCATALLDLEQHIDSTLSGREKRDARGIVRAIGRTWMNNDDLDQGLRVWNSLSDTRLKAADPLTVIQEWANYVRGTNPEQEPEIRYAVALTIWNILEQVHPEDPITREPEFLDELEFFVYRARTVGASDIEQAAAERLYTTFMTHTRDEPTRDTLARKARYEAIIGNPEAMYRALDELLAQDQLDHTLIYNTLNSRPAFNPYRDQRRFQRILTETASAAEGKSTRSVERN